MAGDVFFIFFYAFGESKVSDFAFPVVEQDILGFQVAMKDILIV
jgi:hypothetical protein